MNHYICTAKIKYTRQEVQVHISALKIALNSPRLSQYRGRYEALLKDMERIEGQMFEKESEARLNRDLNVQEVEDSVVSNV
tara:strand:+ start:617 stop:859 length:243 start_codon:yes stop_codon:yes gene_type:complete